MFCNQLSKRFSVEECPMLIGIMRRSAKDTNWPWNSKYLFRSLLKGNTLIQTRVESSLERLLNELAIFKEQCDDNEEALSFDFVAKTGLCWKMVLEVAKYLSLNDAINAFSDNILSSLREYNTRVQISDPSKGFLNIILRKMNVEQIVSLHINAPQFYEHIRLSSFSTLTNVISLTLFNPLALNEIIKYALYFDKLSCLSVWYDHEVYFDDLCQILHKMHRPIRRFEIHCTGIFCPHYRGQSKQVYLQNLTVKYFLFDISHSLVPFLAHWVTECKPCLLPAIIDFIESMHNIQYVRLITSIYNVDEVLQSDQWKGLMDTCSKLKNVTIEMVHSIVFGERLVHKVMEINKPLHTT